MDNLIHLKYHVAFWIFLGVLPSPSFRKFSIAAGLHILNWLNMVCVTLKLATCSKEEICSSLCFIAPLYCVQYRFAITKFHQKRLVRISDCFGFLNAKIRSQKESHVVKNCVYISESIFKLTCLCYCGSIAVLAVTSFTLKQLTIPTWVPFDLKSNFTYYTVIHVIQNVACYELEGAKAASNDSYLVANMILLKSHLKVLSIRVARIGWNCTNHEINYEELLDIIHCHKLLLKSFQEISSWTASSLFVLYSLSTITQCSFAVYITQVDNYRAAVPLIMLLISSTFETLIPCYFGDDLKYESMLFVDSISSCNWIDQSISFKRTLVMLLSKAQKPMVLLAGDCIPCSLSTFFSIQKFAYSIFVVFK